MKCDIPSTASSRVGASSSARAGKARVCVFLAFAFLTLSWPFAWYPLTDGDIAHWVRVAYQLSINNQFLTGANDQAHGPLLAWTGAWLIKPSPTSFYLYNLFNLLCGVLGLGFAYYLAERLWPSQKVGPMAAFVLGTSLVFHYLSRTPMYDWVAAMFYFLFCGFYLVYVREKAEEKDRISVAGNVAAGYAEVQPVRMQGLYWGAMIGIAVASLSRFSMSVGLAGIFMLGVNALYRRPLRLWVRDGLMIWTVCIAINLPWILGQMQAHGYGFLHEFIYDNFGRYFKEPQADAPVHRDYYGFVLYALVAIMPYTVALLTALWEKNFWQRIKTDKLTQAVILGFLPCLAIFSFSGHVKLLRYISFVFPFLLMLVAQQLTLFGLSSETWRRRYRKITIGVGCFWIIGLGIYMAQFSREASDGWLLVVGLWVLVFGLLVLGDRLVTKHYVAWPEQPQRFLWAFGILYILFFSIMAYEQQHTEFLMRVERDIRAGMR